MMNEQQLEDLAYHWLVSGNWLVVCMGRTLRQTLQIP